MLRKKSIEKKRVDYLYDSKEHKLTLNKVDFKTSLCSSDKRSMIALRIVINITINEDDNYNCNIIFSLQQFIFA